MSTKGGLTPAQAQFFATILRNIKGKPDIDWNNVAKEAGYSSGRTAQTRYGQIMKQLEIAAPEAKVQRVNGIEKTKVGSGTNLGAMKITKPSSKNIGGKGRVMKFQGVETRDESDEDEV